MGLLDSLLAAYLNGPRNIGVPPVQENVFSGPTGGVEPADPVFSGQPTVNIRGVPMKPYAPTSANPLGGMLDDFMTMRARNQAQPRGQFDPLGIGSIGGMFAQPPGGAQDLQESAAYGMPLVAAAQGIQPQAPGAVLPAMPPGGAMDEAQAAAYGSMAPNQMNQPRPAPAAAGPGSADEEGGPVQASGETIPLPRPRPADAPSVDVGARGREPGPVGAPLGLLPPGAAPTAPAVPAMPAETEQQKQMSTAMLLALAGGFAGAGSIGTGMRRAFSNASGIAATEDAQTVKKGDLQSTYKDLLAAGVPPATAMAAVRNPAIMKEVADKYYGKGPEAKAPTVRKINTKDGEVDQQWNATSGQWETVPGSAPYPGDKRQKLSVTDVKKLSEDSRNMQAIDRYASGFKDEYAGDVSDTLGNFKNQFGDKAPWAGPEAKQRSEWWRDYQSYRNAVRHGLYGSALTKQESESFLAQDITPGMQPDQVRKVLNRQQTIVRDALKREGSALISAGHEKKAIANAYGVDPSFFGADDEETPAKAAPSARPSGKVTVGGRALDWKVVD